MIRKNEVVDDVSALIHGVQRMTGNRSSCGNPESNQQGGESEGKQTRILQFAELPPIGSPDIP